MQREKFGFRAVLVCVLLKKPVLVCVLLRVSTELATPLTLQVSCTIIIQPCAETQKQMTEKKPLFFPPLKTRAVDVPWFHMNTVMISK